MFSFVRETRTDFTKILKECGVFTYEESLFGTRPMFSTEKQVAERGPFEPTDINYIKLPELHHLNDMLGNLTS